MCLCSPIYNGKPLYYVNKIWPNEWYYQTDLNCLKTAMFEGIEVFVPNNAETIIKRMYGVNCLEEYRIESHTGNHDSDSNLFFDIYIRMKLVKAWQTLNVALNLDSTKNVDGHLSCLIGKTFAELYAISSSNKEERISKHIFDYFKAHLE
jgi:hypothetical protein